jgi:hypothetical protein
MDLFEEHGRVVDALSHIEARDARAVIDARDPRIWRYPLYSVARTLDVLNSTVTR